MFKSEDVDYSRLVWGVGVEQPVMSISEVSGANSEQLLQSDSHRCLVCYRQFKSNVGLVRHLQNQHDYIAPEAWIASEDARCGVCLQQFGNRSSLMSHLAGRSDRKRGAFATSCFIETVLSGSIQHSRQTVETLRINEAKYVAKQKAKGRACRATETRVLQSSGPRQDPLQGPLPMWCTKGLGLVIHPPWC